MSDLDSRNKRASALGIDFPWNRVYPDPDGTIDVNDRQQIAYKYAGTLTPAAANLDTRAKRASAIGIDMSFLRIWPNPDGDINTVGDRQQMAYKYSGISSSVAGGGFLPRLMLLGVG